MSGYHIIFEGKLTGEVAPEQVKKNLASVFKMNATQVESLFTGKPVAIKRDVDETVAKKYIAVFKKAGAVCTVTPAGASATPKAAQKPQAKPATTGASASASADRSGRMAGKDFVNLEVPDDLGSLSMGAAGDTIPVLEDNTPIEIPDTSSLTMSSDDGNLVPEHEVPEPQIDISELSVEEDT